MNSGSEVQYRREKKRVVCYDMLEKRGIKGLCLLSTFPSSGSLSFFFENQTRIDPNEEIKLSKSDSQRVLSSTSLFVDESPTTYLCESRLFYVAQ